MRTNNPLLSTGYFQPKPISAYPSVTPHVNARPLSYSTTSSPVKQNSRKVPVARPSHKRHPKPRLFHKFFNHSILPHNLPDIHLSTGAIANVNYALEHGWADTTLTNYGGVVDEFLGFCAIEGVPSKFQLPADEFVLCAFAASSAGVHAGSTVRNKIAALKAWHTAQNAEWKGSSRLHYVLAGVENLAPESSKRKPRPPITSAMLRALYDGLDFTNPRDVAVFAAACIAFWGQCRLGELLPTSSSPAASKNIPTRAHISNSTRNKRSRIIRLPRTKTKKNGDDVVLVAQATPIDPRVALDMHLLANNFDPNTLLFTFNSPNGSTQLTKSKFLQRCNEIWQAAGYPRTTGHSFRIGGTTELLLAGVPPDVVKAMGRGLPTRSIDTGFH
ncbi:hypothetical protein B0H19DRAFT_1271504 [Mycena capillaripes]|nr:hypothetical protein B0H19DRAFT_1271504 [Mycena capillaripes]